nr:probable leucine-rich repeat receptor-like protein kinase At5g49770 [Ipomoea batatas]GMD48550.1 probable leucine-rich repeat receptor-like protein kinase At5g49770 [Ipomoea batatas]
MDLSNNIGLKGTLPSSIGKLKKLTIFFSGPIPDSIGSLPQLVYFHLSKNQLSGTIPPKLFNPYMMLKHVRLDSNLLNGSIPDNLNNLTKLHELYLSNNILTGPTPILTGMNHLYYLELSNNSFNASEVPPWFLSLQSLTTM